MGFGTSFDYVVVGAGTAGCALAARLSEVPDRSVLLLEAGGSDDRPAVRATDIGSMAGLWGDAGATWQYVTVPQAGLGGRTVPLPQGKMLGGGSSVNAMMYVRGNRRDFDRWRDLGNPGWGYADVLPYFQAAESYAGGDAAYRGRHGPLRVLDYPSPSVVSQAFVTAAGERTGHPGGAGADYNGARQEDVPFYYQSTRSTAARRCSTADAFLRPALGRPNLTVHTGATARRVLLDGDAAVGVEYLRDGVRHQVGAAAEVIVSAGTLGSPRLLMLSGIGPADHLRACGIEPSAHLPGVGQNLHDHVLLGVGYAAELELPFPQLLSEAGLFTHTPAADPAGPPNLQFFFGPVQFVPDEYKIDGPGFTFAPILAQPRSRGTVTLNPAHPSGPPVVDPHYLEQGADVDVLVEGIAVARELVGTAAFAGLRGRELAPGDGVRDRAALAAYVRATASTVWHPVGTCAMGTGPAAVVDPRLRVRGISGLRVADASIMPTITAGNTNAAAIMIGHRAADLITGAGADTTGPAAPRAADLTRTA
ncbi:MAG: choline dehydrogenase [Mycobacteriales bacterium]